MDFLRLKQSGVQRDFTGALADSSDAFALDRVVTYGFPSTVSTLAYDPVQSLLAVGTHENGQFSGEVHVFGQARVHVKFALLRKASVKALQLCNSRVVVLDSKNGITVFDLQASGASGVGYSPPGVVTTMCTDPCLDWLFLGLQNGEVIAYDVDREALSPFRIPNFWRERSPRARLLPVVSLMLHPKDVGTLLIAYLEGVVVYSLKQNAVVHYLEFELPPGAPGADTELSVIRTSRKPRVSQAVWHPTGTFICTTYEDSVMAIWNSKDGTIVQARTLQGSGVHLPGRLPEMNMFNDSDDISVRQSIFKIAWCSTNNPDDTSLLIAGGNFMTVPRKGMTLLELGPSPNMLASSVKFVSDHFASPHGQRSLPIPSDLDVIDFCLISRSSPHYGGAHDPVAIIALLVSGELVMLGFPDGQALSPSSLLNPSFSLAHPFASRIDVSAVDRTRWLGMVPSQHGPADMVVGGMEHPKPLRRYGSRVIVQSSHPNGMVRIWDVGHADQVENGAVVELDVGRALQKTVDLKIEAVSMAGNTGETAVGMETGEVVVFRWGYNKLFGHTAEYTGTTTKPLTEEAISFKEGLTDVNMWADPALKEGLLPVCVLDQKCGSVVALKISDVGFCAVAYQTGHLCVLDMRGPAVIYHQSLTTMKSEAKRASLRRGSKDQSMAGEKATCLEFGVLTLEGDEFSSICLFVGTFSGRVLTFKILPQPKGGFTCVFAGINHLEDSQIVSITPLNADSGSRSWATPQALANLRNGIKTPGVVVTVSKKEVRIFKPPGAKGAHKSFEDSTCISSAVCELEGYGICLTCVMNTAVGVIINSYSIPGLKQIATVPAKQMFENSLLLPQTRVLESGHILGWTGEQEIGLVYQWGEGVFTSDKIPPDTLYNPAIQPLPRPTISNLQWLTGVQYITIADLDMLIGGPDRPISKQMQQQLRMEHSQAKLDARMPQKQQQQGVSAGEGDVWGDMAKSMRERTERLGLTADSMDKLGETSASFANDVSKYVNQQKKKAVFGAVMGKWL